MKDGFGYIKIVGPGVDALERREPEAVKQASAAFNRLAEFMRSSPAIAKLASLTGE